MREKNIFPKVTQAAQHPIGIKGAAAALASIGFTGGVLLQRRLSYPSGTPAMSSPTASRSPLTFTSERRPSVPGTAIERMPGPASLQQTRSSYTTSRIEPGLPVDEFGTCLGMLRSKFPEVKHAELVGGHLTAAERAEGIIENGPDLSRAGENWGGWGLSGKGFYAGLIPNDLKESGLRAGQNGEDLQLVLFFRLPGEAPVKRVSVAEYSAASKEDREAVDEVVEGSMLIKRASNTMATAAALEGDRQEYFLVALPAFGQDKLDEVMTQVEKLGREVDPPLQGKSKFAMALGEQGKNRDA